MTTTAMLPCPTSIARAEKPARPEDGIEPSLEIWTKGTAVRRKANGGFPDELALASLGICQLGFLKGATRTTASRAYKAAFEPGSPQSGQAEEKTEAVRVR